MKTTAKHFEIFKAACEHYRQKLGLTDWEFCYAHNGEHGRVLAAVHRDNESRTATVCLSTDWDATPITPQGLRGVARHEVLHVLLGELEDLSMSRINPRERWIAAEHAVIHRVERFL